MQDAFGDHASPLVQTDPDNGAFMLNVRVFLLLHLDIVCGGLVSRAHTKADLEDMGSKFINALKEATGPEISFEAALELQKLLEEGTCVLNEFGGMEKLLDHAKDPLLLAAVKAWQALPHTKQQGTMSGALEELCHSEVCKWIPCIWRNLHSIGVFDNVVETILIHSG